MTPEEEEKLFSNRLKASLQDAENLRLEQGAKIKQNKKLALSLCIFCVIYFCIVLIFPFLIKALNSQNTELVVLLNLILSIMKGIMYPGIPLGILGSIYFAVKSYALLTDYKKHVKELLVPVLMRKYFRHIEYKAALEIQENDLAVFKKVLPDFNAQIAEDHISAQYKGIRINLCDMQMVHKGDEKKVIFSGMAAKFTFNMRFRCETCIVTKNHPRLHGLLKIRHDSRDFNRIFDVYAEDTTLAKTLLSEKFIENYLKMNRLFATGPIRCVFLKENVYLLLPTDKKNFEIVKTLERPLCPKDFEGVFLQIKEALMFIDSLGQSEKVG